MNSIPTFLHETKVASLWFIRSLKKGDWVWLMLAIIIASATVTVVKQLGESVQQSMLRKASESLGADLVIRSSQPIDKQWQIRAEELGLKTSTTISVVTMAVTYDANQEAHFQLINLTGISDTQPLRGSWTPSDEIPFQPLNDNNIWLDPSLFSLLPLNQDSEITLGTKTFKLGGSLTSPALISPMANIAPVVWIKKQQLEQIGLMGPGSRINYSLSVAGADPAVKRFANELQQTNNGAWQIMSAEAPSEDLGNSLDTAWLFLDLSALSAVLVAGMSILIASRFYLSRWKQSIALMRAFGAHNAKMNRLFALQMTWIAAISSFIGIWLGYVISLGMEPLLADYFDPLVIASPVQAMITGFFSGLLVLWTFAWQAFHSVVKTPPMQVLKSTPDQKQNWHWFISFLLLIGLISLMLNLHNLHWIILGILVTSIVLYGVALLMMQLLALLQKRSSGWLKIALSNIAKESSLVKIQLISVGMVLFVLMLMTFVRQDLITNWKSSLPANTPNAFAINIQPDQKPQVDEILAQTQMKTDAPMVRGRLVKKNDVEIDINQFQEERAQRLLRREANIAVMDTIPEHNKIIQQTEISDSTLPVVSVEKGIAELFGLKIGDTLTFNISGLDYKYVLTSLREVKWQSFQLNFFFIIEPAEDRVLPISYLSNFKLVDIENSTASNEQMNSNELTKQLAQQTPGVLLIDVRKILQQIQDIMDQAGLAVTALYSFTLIASLIVLFTATLASQQSRIQSWLLLRTIGAKNHEIFKIGLTEFFFLGGLAGLFAATLAQAASMLISHFLLKIPAEIDIVLWITSMLLGGGIFFIIGLVTQWSYLQKSPRDLKTFLSDN